MSSLVVAIFLSISQIWVSSIYRRIDSLEATSNLVTRVGAISTDLSLASQHRLLAEQGKPVMLSSLDRKLWDQRMATLDARTKALEKGSEALGVPAFSGSASLDKQLRQLAALFRKSLAMCDAEFRGTIGIESLEPFKTTQGAINQNVLAVYEELNRERLGEQQKIYVITIGSFVTALLCILTVTALIVRPMVRRFGSAYVHIATQNEDLESMNQRMTEQQNVLVQRNAELVELQELQALQANELRENADKLSRALEHSQQASQVARFSASRFQELFQGIPVPAFTFDPIGTIYEWNQAVSRLFGVQGFEVFQQSIFGIVFKEEEREEIQDIVRRVFNGENIQNFEREDVHHGIRRFLLLNFFPLRNSLNEVVGGVCATVDITERKLAEEQLLNYQAQVKEQMGFITEQNVLLQMKQQELEEANQRLEDLANKDGLTGLLNHRSFQDELEQVFQAAKQGYGAVSLILMDVDKFKSLNDTYGHPAGDKVLVQVARVLRENALANEVVCRYGGEEFAIVCDGSTLAEAIEIAERYRHAIETSEWEHRLVTASFGVSQAELADPSRAEMIARADQSLYAAKSAGRNCVKAITEDDPPQLRIAS
ncbi:MAG: GGDEF domain-containing protein [Chthonomonas sp.]|nr:GGDEF domain-containing protein [Chthonomonas sp.]